MSNANGDVDEVGRRGPDVALLPAVLGVLQQTKTREQEYYGIDFNPLQQRTVKLG